MSSTTADSAGLAGRTAVVTGASRGIGRECARALSAAGATLVLVARDERTLEETGRSLAGAWTAFACRMDEPDVVAAVLATIGAHLHDAPDILVNNAGQFRVSTIESTPMRDFARTLAVNLSAQFAFVRAFLPAMRARGSGHIVSIGSTADHRALPGNAAYAASKYGVRGMHEVLREETLGSGVRATLVSPGPTDTSIWDDIAPDGRAGFTPRARMLPAAAVADAVRYVVTRPADTNIDELRVSRA